MCSSQMKFSIIINWESLKIEFISMGKPMFCGIIGLQGGGNVGYCNKSVLYKNPVVSSTGFVISFFSEDVATLE